MLANQTLLWQQEEEEELRRRGRFSHHPIQDSPSSPRLQRKTKESSQAPTTPDRRPTRTNLTPSTEVSRSSKGKRIQQNLWPELESTKKAIDLLLFDAVQPERVEQSEAVELDATQQMGSSDSSWSPNSTMCNFSFGEGGERMVDPLAEAGLELMKTSLRDVATQTFVTKRFGTSYTFERELKSMPCAQHTLAVKKAGGPHPSFRTTSQRLAPAWEQSAAGLPSNMVFRGGKIANTVSFYQGNNKGVGPGSYDNMHKDRFGALQVGDRSKTIWDLHVYDE